MKESEHTVYSTSLTVCQCAGSDNSTNRPDKWNKYTHKTPYLGAQVDNLSCIAGD